jgi:hypothetical protein
MSNRFISIGVLALVLAIIGLGFGYYNYTQTRSNTMLLRLAYETTIDGNCYWHSTVAAEANCYTKPATSGYCISPYTAAPPCIVAPAIIK